MTDRARSPLPEEYQFGDAGEKHGVFTGAACAHAVIAPNAHGIRQCEDCGGVMPEDVAAAVLREMTNEVTR